MTLPQEYSFDIETINLPKEGELQWARWRHPSETACSVSQAEVDHLREFLKPGDVAIDIGAYTGDTAVPMALAVGPRGMVLALEPNPHVFKVLLANAALNRKKTNIHALPFAATEQDGGFVFNYSDNGFCNGGMHPGIPESVHQHYYNLLVQGRNLTTYLDREFPKLWAFVRYIKIDTEGADRLVVKSMAPLLRAARPYIRSEIFIYTSEAERLAYYQELRDLGYKVHLQLPCAVGPELQAEDMLKTKHFDIFAVPADQL